MSAENPPQPFPPHLVARFGDIDEFTETVRGFDLEWQQLDAGPLTADLQQVQSPAALVTNVDFSRKFLQRGSCPKDARTFGLPAESVLDFTWCGAPAAAGQLMAFPLSEYDAVSQPGFTATTLTFPDELLVRVERSLGLEGSLESRAEPGTVLRCDPHQVAHLRSRLQSVSRAVLRQPALAGSEAVRHELEFEIPAALLLAAASGEPPRRRAPAYKRTRALREALAFISANRHEPLRVQHLCEVTGVSWRTLNYAFGEGLDMTPKQYLQTQRLTGVRRGLLRAAAGTKVADVANEWGFWHLGQFAADYRRQFGELPSATLARVAASIPSSGSHPGR